LNPPSQSEELTATSISLELSMIAPGPTGLRDLFTLFLLYDRESGIEGLVRKVDLTGFDRRKIYHAVLGRRPETNASCRTPDDYLAADHFLEALQSAEFQASVLKLLLRAFPDRKRIIFVHIPKCAGTDLIDKVARKYPSANNTLASHLWTAKPDLFKAISRVVSEIQCFDALFVFGHIKLAWLISQDLVRPFDDCFTIVRDPAEMVLSQVNYVLTRFFAGPPSVAATDVKQWLSMLGIDRVPEDISALARMNLARAILRNKNLCPPNNMCRQLGFSPSGGDPNASSAINNIIASNIEVTDTTRYDTWCQRKFGHSQSTRMNKSNNLFRTEDLSTDDREHILTITAEDQKLYETIVRSLRKSDSLSIRGDDLNKG
jgi:hypothetical protein